LCEQSVTRLGCSTLLLNSKVPEQSIRVMHVDRGVSFLCEIRILANLQLLTEFRLKSS